MRHALARECILEQYFCIEAQFGHCNPLDSSKPPAKGIPADMLFAHHQSLLTVLSCFSRHHSDIKAKRECGITPGHIFHSVTKIDCCLKNKRMQLLSHMADHKPA
jgi:hypothetical protein